MSKKRTIEELHLEGDGADKSKSLKATPAAVGFGAWEDLPPELIRRIGQLQNGPRDLACMERTCRSWRKIIID